jgi:hypothetical protein
MVAESCLTGPEKALSQIFQTVIAVFLNVVHQEWNEEAVDVVLPLLKEMAKNAISEIGSVKAHSHQFQVKPPVATVELEHLKMVLVSE